MKLFSLFRDGKVKPAWEFRATGKIWRVLFSDKGRIVGEDRDETTKTVTFFCLKESTGEILWRGIMQEERWWIGIETIHDGIIYLHEYVKPDLPQHFKIIALGLEDGNLLWKNEEVQPLFVAGGSFYGAKDFFEKRVYVELDSYTGEIRREFLEEEENIIAARREENVSYKDMVFPEVFEEGIEGCEGLSSTIHRQCDSGKVVGNVEFIYRGNLLFFSYHEKTEGGTIEKPVLKNYLKVVNPDRQHLILSEVLNENTSAPTPDSFFLKGRQLFLLKNKNTLVAIRLEELERKK